MRPDDEYTRFLLACAKECRCCPDCSDVPCGGCTAGGVCDDFRCTCDETADPYDDEDDQ